MRVVCLCRKVLQTLKQNKMKAFFTSLAPTFVAVLLALSIYGFLDKLLFSKMAHKLENLIEGK